MIEINKDDKIEINRILESVKGRIDQKLCKLIMDLIFQNKVGIKKEDERLFSTNQERIPDSLMEAFSLGSFFGQTYQIGMDLAKKLDLKLDSNQKRILREFTLFLVLFKFEKEITK
jgi:plasmid maintenance system antidote protein VapI